MGYLKETYGIDVKFEQKDPKPSDFPSLRPIGHPENPYPIPYHPSQEWFDSTKLEAYRDCGRKFFFEYMLGWSPRSGSVHLVFGSAIHAALEYFYNSLMRGGPGVHKDNLAGAFDAFMTYWEANFNPLLMAEKPNKNPKRAIEILNQYISEYKSDNTEFEVLYTETVGDVPIDEKGTMLRVKMDAVIKHKREGWVAPLEHKTLSAFGQSWVDQWEMAIQPGSYQYATQGMFDDARGVIINGLIFRSKDYSDKSNFFRQRYFRPRNQMAQWLAIVYDLIDRYERDRQILISVGEKMKKGIKSTVLPCFLPGPCKWGCSFPSLCTHWTNPLEQNLSSPPPAYSLRFWDPKEEKHSFELNKGVIAEVKK